MSASNQWCVAVFTCPSNMIKQVLVGVYRFLEGTEGVQNLHFLSKDRVDNEIIFSLRVLVTDKSKGVVKSKLAYKLGTLLAQEKYVIDPVAGHCLEQYVSWNPSKKLEAMGPVRFNQFIDALKKISGVIIEMFELDTFDASERTEMAYAVSQMLCCTEYGALYASEFEVGYYDRLEDKYWPNLRQKLEKQN
jgi:hypothetical protein